jgi:ribosomal protein S9
MAGQYYEGIGRRKTSTARVRLWPSGNGTVIINDKPADDYLPRQGDLDMAMEPLRAVGQEASYNVTVKVSSLNGATHCARANSCRAIHASRNAKSPVSSVPARPRPIPSVSPAPGFALRMLAKEQAKSLVLYTGVLSALHWCPADAIP